jgi:hypothetical protein
MIQTPVTARTKIVMYNISTHQQCSPMYMVTRQRHPVSYSIVATNKVNMFALLRSGRAHRIEHVIIVAVFPTCGFVTVVVIGKPLHRPLSMRVGDNEMLTHVCLRKILFPRTKIPRLMRFVCNTMTVPREDKTPDLHLRIGDASSGYAGICSTVETTIEDVLAPGSNECAAWIGKAPRLTTYPSRSCRYHAFAHQLPESHRGQLESKSSSEKTTNRSKHIRRLAMGFVTT